MKVAKIISFIAFALNSLFTISSVFIFLKMRSTFQELELQTPFPWFVFILFAVAVINFIYWLYLRNKERKGEIVRFALWISIALLLIPWLFLYPAALISIFQPFYDLIGAVD